MRDKIVDQLTETALGQLVPPSQAGRVAQYEQGIRDTVAWAVDYCMQITIVCDPSGPSGCYRPVKEVRGALPAGKALQEQAGQLAVQLERWYPMPPACDA